MNVDDLAELAAHHLILAANNEHQAVLNIRDLVLAVQHKLAVIYPSPYIITAE